MLTILRAEREVHFEQARELFKELAAWDLAQAEGMDIDPKAVSEYFYAAPDGLPGPYAPPGGGLLLAIESGKAAACVAFRRLSSESCELKRMYVRPAFRGAGLGRRLVDTLIQAARESGYRLIRLETTTAADNAISLYRAVGFISCPPYYSIPECFRGITIFMELKLSKDI